jgi:pyruvyl transferase EpsO
MKMKYKTEELKNLIIETLTPLITNNYIFLDLPYFSNIGDLLIWQGTLDYLQTLPYTCLYSSSIENYRRPQIGADVVILLMGGGNFGDLWYRHQTFRRKILESFPENKIILLPQSIYFADANVLKEDALVFSKHKNLTMCFRDAYSLMIAKDYFPNSRNILLPDMAFCMNFSKWEKYIKSTENRILFLDRKDSEKNHKQNYEDVPAEAEIHDWPTIEKTVPIVKIFRIIQRILKIADDLFASNLNNYVSDFVYQKILRKSLIKKGIRFLSVYSYAYTTRLHVAILSVLLEKGFSFFG